MDIIKKFKNLIEKSSKIVISTHTFPDADGIGSQIALCLALESLKKKVYCVNEAELLPRYHYLDEDKRVISYSKYKNLRNRFRPDLFIVVDTSSLDRIGEGVKKLTLEAKNLLFIDHHPCPKELMALHCIDTSASATGELAGNLIESLGVELSQKLSLLLYTSILIDTSSFRYPTVSGKTHRLLAKLLDSGIKPAQAYNKIYGTKKVSYLKLLGKILSEAKSTEDGDIAWICLYESQLKKYNVDFEDTHGFVNHLLILGNLKVACMFKERGDNVKISFRSTGEINVEFLAQALGGGGHKHSAAASRRGAMKEVIPEVISKIKLILKERYKDGPKSNSRRR
ncbi:MAG: bifunctional oligoribonuclease/PAP phosphatase NrnA [Bdellovibrionota bacterium]|nr:bifunctional oligoribonuclease/PAP phosphatase NrnA [Bdellovibrionota bacterium]